MQTHYSALSYLVTVALEIFEGISDGLVRPAATVPEQMGILTPYDVQRFRGSSVMLLNQ